MAAPSNIVLNPSSELSENLPVTINVSGSNIFERPDYTDRELFTQTDIGDAPAGNWFGGATKVDGIIGDAFQGNGINSYIDLSNKIPTINNKFIGVSFRFKVNTTTGVQTLVWLNDTTNSYTRIIDVSISSSNISVATTINSYTNWSSSNVQQYTFTASNGVWYHCFAYVDLDDTRNGGRRAYIFIDGIEGTTQLYNNPMSDFSANPNIFEVGNKLNNSAVRADQLNGDICNLYWSTNPNFKNYVDEYANLPIVEIN